jgi:membrane protein
MRVPGTDLTWRGLGEALAQAWKRDNVSNLAAALTFYGVLALVPFLIFLVALCGVLISPEQVQALFDGLDKAAPSQVSALIQNELHSIVTRQSFDLLTLGFVGTLWSASGAMLGLQQGLNAVHGVVESRPYWKARGIAVLMTLVTAGFFLGGALFALVGPWVGRALGGKAEAAINLLRLPLAIGLVMFAWALLYWALPDVKLRFRFFSAGSVVGVLLWATASLGFSTFVANFGHYEATYGALGGVIVLLLWMWISAQVLLFGAELNNVIDCTRDCTRRPPPDAAQPGPPAPPQARRPFGLDLAVLLGVLALRRRRG